MLQTLLISEQHDMESLQNKLPCVAYSLHL